MSVNYLNITLTSICDDIIIDDCLLKLQNYYNIFHPNIQVVRFVTVFFTTLRSRGIGSIRRWSKKMNFNIEESTFLFFPIHHKPKSKDKMGHWSLITASIKEKKILWYDPLGFEYKHDMMVIILTYIQFEFQTRGLNFKIKEWKFSDISYKLPLQTNDIDCGFYIIFTAHLIATNQIKNDSVNIDSIYVRKFVVNTLRQTLPKKDEEPLDTLREELEEKLKDGMKCYENEYNHNSYFLYDSHK